MSTLTLARALQIGVLSLDKVFSAIKLPTVTRDRIRLISENIMAAFDDEDVFFRATSLTREPRLKRCAAGKGQRGEEE